MGLSDYDILGVSKKANFRTIKNAYHDLARIYHPDSTLILIHKLSKEEKTIAFNIIQTAYSNIKKKLNITEIDLPQNDLNYEELNIKQNKNIKDLESFNTEFNKVHSEQSKDEPYSIHYQEPNDKLDDTKIILKERNYNSNPYEFGVNYVSDYTGEYYTDVNNNTIISSSENIIKEKIDTELEDKLEELINKRNEVIELSEKEKQFIENQNKYNTELEEKKTDIEQKRINNLRLT